MKILFLTQHFYPEPNFVTTDIANFLCAQSHSVSVITAHPNYPFGKFYSSIKSIKPKISVENGVRILRLPFIPNHNLSKLKRGISYLSFLLMTMFSSLFFERKPDVVIVYQTPFSMGIAALIYKYLFRSKIIYICADLWPESFTASKINVPNKFYKLLYAYSKWINKFADTLVCTTKGMLDRYAQDGIAKNKLVYIPVWISASASSLEDNTEMNKKKQNDVFSLVYAGNLGPAQNLEVLVEAAKILSLQEIKIHFHIYGTGADEDKLKNLSLEYGLKNIFFHGRVQPSEVVKIVKQSDAQFVHLQSSPLFAMTLPSKLGFSLSMGVPILCGLEGEARNVAEESKGCVLFKSGEAQDLSFKLIELMNSSLETREKMGENCVRYYNENLRIDLLLNKYLEIVNSCETSKTNPVPTLKQL